MNAFGRCCVLFCAVWVSAAAPAPGRRPAANPSQTAARQGDAGLEKSIRDRFARSKIGADGFTVRVQGGVATLEGQTSVLQHKGTATRLARNAGAVEVVNRIQVSEAARRKASENLAKGRRRAQLKRSESGARSEPRGGR